MGQPVMPKSSSSGSSNPRQGSAGAFPDRKKGWIPLLMAAVPYGKVGSPQNLLSLPGSRSQTEPCPGGFMDYVQRMTP